MFAPYGVYNENMQIKVIYSDIAVFCQINLKHIFNIFNDCHFSEEIVMTPTKKGKNDNYQNREKTTETDWPIKSSTHSRGWT